MIDNFEILENYVIPKKLFLSMLKAYKNIGKSEIYLNNLESKMEQIENSTLEKDVYFFCKILENYNIISPISDNRMKLLITKNSEPKNMNEKMVTGVKKVISDIFTRDYLETINSSDVLMYLNIIFNNRIKFDMRALKDKSQLKINSNASTRAVFNDVIEKYFIHLTLNYYEPLMLSIIAFLELWMIKPYRNIKEEEDPNFVASLLLLYYMIQHMDIKNFRIVSFFYRIYDTFDKLEKEIRIATVNYGENYFKLNEITLYFLNIINNSFDSIANETKKYLSEEKYNKSLNVESTILSLEKCFTKDDIRQIHPYVSESTIMRALIKLRDEKLIQPLGTGRNAKWLRLIEDNDPRRFLR